MSGAGSDRHDPRRGRHRRGSTGVAWTPPVPQSRGRRPASHLRGIDTVEPVDPEADTAFLPAVIPDAVANAYPQTPPTGLRKFDLGSIPASVTPPRTWRRAAAFAVVTSVAVVLGLMVAAIALVGPPRSGEQIEALPGYPTQPLLLTELPNAGGENAPATTTTSQPATSTTTRRADRTPRRPAKPAGSPQAPAPGAAAPDGAAPAPGPGSPTRTTLPAAPVRPPTTDAEKMGDNTELYFHQVTENPQAAVAMTTGPMRSEGEEGIEQRYGDVERIEVERITIDPNWSTTRSTLKIVKKDGTVITEERQLTFSYGADPKISSDGAAS